MKYCIALTGLAIVGLFGQSGVVIAGEMRCGKYVIVDGIGNGHTKYEIMKKCGEPTERYGTTWVYDRPGKQRVILNFGINGVLHVIHRV